MGSSFFKKSAQAAPGGPGGLMGPQGRAMGASIGAIRGASIGSAKDIGAAQGINKSAYKGPMKRSAAYPPGPKKT